MRCVGTDLKFHWVRHDEDDTPTDTSPAFAGEATAIDGGGGEAGTGRDGGGRGGTGAGSGDDSHSSGQRRRGKAPDRVTLKRKVCEGGGVGLAGGGLEGVYAEVSGKEAE